MEPRRSRVSSSVRTEGGLLPADLVAKIAAADPAVPGLTEADFGLGSGERVREAITRSWNRLVGAWAVLAAERAKASEGDPLTSPTRERFLLPLLEELGFGRLPAARAIEVDGTSYPISHGYGERVPVHLVGITIELDARTKGVRGAAGAAPHALVQEYLNRTDAALWGLVSNGRSLRLLRDSTSLTRAAYVEFDLEAIFAGELYADFALLWTVCHRSRFEGERTVDCLLERWTRKAADDGTRALDKLRGGVERSIETLGAGFLAHPDNAALRSALRSGDLDRQDYYRELLRLVYRLIFLFTAEDRHDEARGRELLLDPEAPDDAVERYRRFYSTARLRTLAARRRGTRHGDLWVALRLVTGALGGAGAPSIALPPLGSFLFGPGACPHLDAASLRNEDLLAAIRALTTIEEDRRLRPIDYRNLGAEELGSVYEGLLELHPAIEMDANPPRFELSSAAGNERKATGSYYTPSSLISCLLDSALDPVVDDALKGKKGPDAEAALLGLAVVDPAAGSGHFLVAAAHRLAKRLAAIRTEEAEPPPAAIRHALRDVIAHCIYAADINPMAVELCKVSLWLEALEPGRPLSFLDAHIKSGNSLLGTTPELAAAGIPDAAYEALTGDDKPTAREWRKRNAAERSGQQTLFEAPLALPTAALAAEARSVDALPDESPAAIAAKAARHAAYETSSDYRRSKAALDAWCAAFVAPKTPGAHEITTAVVRALGTNPAGVPAALRDTVERIAAEYAFFNWPLEFPAIFAKGGFDVVLGNPPFLNRLQKLSAIERAQTELLEARMGPAVRGYVDLSAIFLLHSVLISRPTGMVGMVQPQSILSARDAGGVRGALMQRSSPRFIWTATESVFTANVLTVAIALKLGTWDVSDLARALGPAFDPAPGLVVNAAEVCEGQGWAGWVGEAFGGRRVSVVSDGVLGDLFECTADFRDQYYGLVPYVQEWPAQAMGDEGHAPLITTGLLDPLTCHWGSRSTKFAKAKWTAPVIDVRMLEAGDPKLGDWARRRRIPKLLLATQARVLEGWVDETGACLPSVPVISVMPRSDEDLWLAAAITIAPPVVSWAIELAGGAGLSAEAIKLSARQVAQIPLPTDREAWKGVAAKLKAAASDPSGPERDSQLRHCAGVMSAAYGVEDPDSLTAWWVARCGRTAGGSEE